MHRAMLLGASALTVLALGACQKKAETAAAGDAGKPAAATVPAARPMSGPPTRKAGLWSQTINTAGINQTMKMCLDADTDAKMSVWGQAMGKSTCSKNSFSPTPGGWKFESTCEMGEGGTITSTGTATGDFNSAYTVKVSSVTTGAKMAQANGTHEVQIDAKWEGACPAGMKGGDVQINVPGMAKGMTINLEQMSGHKN